jgi:hypothetical protein
MVSVGLAAWLVLASQGALTFLAVIVVLFVVGCSFLYYRSRETSRMFSAVRLGEAALGVRVKARALLGQYLLYAVCLLGALIVLGVLGFAVSAAFSTNLRGAEFSAGSIARAGWIGVVLAAGGYLAGLSAFTLLGEVFIDCGYWMLLSRNAMITNLDSLDGVRAIAEDTSLAGEGLADALNVGSF